MRKGIGHRLFAVITALTVVLTASTAFAQARKKDAGGGGVTFAAQPAERSFLESKGVGTDQWGFVVYLDTHSFDLSGVDVAGGARLRTPTAVELKPIAWRGLSESGHHRSGLLLFSADAAKKLGIDPGARGAVELVLRDVAGVPQRVLRWD